MLFILKSLKKGLSGIHSEALGSGLDI